MTANQVLINPTVDTDPGYGQLLAILWRRRLWIISITGIAIAIAFGYTLRQKPVYVSSLQLLVEPNYQGKQEQRDIKDEFADLNVEIDRATQINLMQSSGLLKRAMTLLQDNYPDMNPTDPGSVVAFQGALEVIQVVQKGSEKDTATKIFQVVYTGSDPVKSQQVLKALQTVYQDYNLEQQRLRLAKGLSFINKQLPQVRDQVRQSETALEKFRRSQQLINPELEANAQVQSLNQTLQEQLNTKTQIQELQSRYSGLLRQVNLAPQQAVLASRLSQSTRYQSLLAEIQKTELALVQERLRFKNNTPYVEQIQEQRQRQLELLRAELNRSLGRSTLASGSNEQLLSQGQLGGLDITLVNQLVEVQVNLRSAEARYQGLLSAEEQLRAELKRFPMLLAEYNRLQPEIELNRETLQQLLKAQQELGLDIARGGFDWQVVEEPQLGSRRGTSTTRNLLLGAVAGLMLGGTAAFLKEASDDSIHTPEDLKKQVTVPILGTIPELLLEVDETQPIFKLPFRKSQGSLPSISQVIHWKPFRDALDILYQNVQLLNHDGSLKSLVVTSALAGEGRSTLVLGLAISAARLHQRVLLIDADLRNPSLHKLLNLPNDKGLSSFLTSDAPIPQAIAGQASGLRSNISVLTAGAPATDPAKLLSSRRMRDVMATFERTYDLVLLDAPPVLGMVDAILTASCCSGVLMVSRLDRVTRTELSQAIATLNQLNVVGVVASGTTRPTIDEVHYQN